MTVLRVGTTYIPVTNVGESADWYVNKLGAVLNYIDADKAILDLANQAFFLVKSRDGQSANFIDYEGKERFSLTFEVDGLEALTKYQQDLMKNEVRVGEIEDRGHAGNNFVFYDIDGNMFDVWSELSPTFKEKYL
ncbi:VOC family protein [Bacillus suaedaesalsae]|uniref:VOC family protein n=1 Tax=Bacillus suaedaesalsae TaxID=2810349 RepID=A0ABS2DL36_9BACI|nr:VOC family protein [Bacillus suaedaesalsae]